MMTTTVPKPKPNSMKSPLSNCEVIVLQWAAENLQMKTQTLTKNFTTEDTEFHGWEPRGKAEKPLLRKNMANWNIAGHRTVPPVAFPCVLSGQGFLFIIAATPKSSLESPP